MAEKKRGCLGCSFPILILVVVIFLGLAAVGLLSGPIGKGFFESFGIPPIPFPEWMVVPQPAPHLPAPVLFHIFFIPVTNTILATWITVVFLVVLSWAVTRRMKLVPGRLQGLFESLLGWMYDFCLGVAGDKWARKFFPVVCTIFLFVLFNAWLSLIPGFTSITYNEYEPIPENMQVVAVEGHEGEWELVPIDAHVTEGGYVTGAEGHIERYEIAVKDGEYMILHEEELIRGANTDVNTPLAIAIISFFFVAYFGFKALGVGWAKQYLNFGPFFCAIGRIFKGKFSFMDIFSGFVDAFVGLLELLSRFISIVSFTFRLFGNMTAGEILLAIVAFLVPYVLAIPFYGLELLIGFVQALVFAGLTLVFVTMAVTPHDGGSH